MTLLIIDLWEYYVCYKRSGVTRCTILMMLYLCGRMCQCGLHAVHNLDDALPWPYRYYILHNWSDIDTLMRLLTAEPRSTAGLLFNCLYLCGTILVTLYSTVWDWRFSRAGPMSFHWPSCSLHFCLLLCFLSLLSSLLSFYWLV